MPEIAAHSSAHRIRLRKAPRIHCVVAREKTGVAKVYRNFDHVAKRGAVRLEDGGNVVDGLLGLLFNRIAHQYSAGRIYRTGAGHEDEIPSSPSLGVRPSRRRATLARNFVFSHVVLSASQLRCAVSNQCFQRLTDIRDSLTD